jgi:HSP20 family protein
MKLQERMNRLFEQTLSRGGGGEEDVRGGGWAPAVDIEESVQRIVLRADLPGVSLEQVELKIENDRLTLRGERAFPSSSRREDFHRIERPFGSFFRSFTLPQTIDQAAIQAELKNGVLEVRLPKKSETRTKQIQVQIR